MSSRFVARIKTARPTHEEARRLRWVYVPYDRLTAEVGPLAREKPADVGVVFVESTEKAKRRPYHKQKLALLLANERHFALELAAKGWKIFYEVSDKSIGDALLELQTREKLGPLTMMRPAERELRVDMATSVRLGLKLNEVPDETWLTTAQDFRVTFPDGAPYRMDRFYRTVRQRTGFLMERGKPLGGKYSHDAENRKAWHGEPPAPVRPRYPIDQITREVLELVEEKFPDHFGSLDDFNQPTTHADAETAWRFSRSLLPLFGPYEDAMSSTSHELFHSKLSPLINLSRVLPGRVVAETARDFAEGKIPLASAEGFIRQILGWREFVRHVHAATDGFRQIDDVHKAQALESPLPLPPVYWGVKSGMSCLDTVVASVIAEGYSHHITRLMVLGNVATLAGFSARALTDWFWFAYVDAYDWVVEPNVLGMASYADGGLMTTKPYVSGAAYINKMSDYCDGCALDPKKSSGPGACPMTALYWTFLERNREKLAGNQRISLPLASAKKKSAAEMKLLHATASQAIETLSRGERLDAGLEQKKLI